MASKAEAKARLKRKPAQSAEEQKYLDMLDEDRMEDPNSVAKDINANTDDEGNPIATKDSIHMAKTKSDQTIRDQRAWAQGQTDRAVDEERRKAKAKAARSAGK